MTSLFCIFPLGEASNCDINTGDYYTFVHSDILKNNTDNINNYLLSLRLSVLDDGEMRQQQDKANIEEWRQKLCSFSEDLDVFDVVYNSDEYDLDDLKLAIKNKNAMPSTFRGNTFAQQLAENGCKETIDYLIFAKECEPYATTPENRVANDMMELADVGVKQFKRTKSDFIKLRYTYQIVRLAHYAKEYSDALELYNYLLPKFDPTESIVNDWLLAHKAGILKSLGKRVEAAYLFSKIFKNCPSKREQAFRSFSIKTAEEWTACLHLCQLDDERVTLYVLRSLQKGANIFEEIKNVYAFNPAAPELDGMIIREIKKLEKDFLQLHFRHKDSEFYKKQPIAIEKEKHIIELKRVMEHYLKENKIANPKLWRLALGYVQYLSGDFHEAHRAFLKAKTAYADDEAMQSQIEVFDLALQIESYEKIDIESLNEIANIIRFNPIYKSDKDFHRFLDNKLASLYTQAEHPGLAYLCHYPFEDLYLNPKLNVINDLLATINKADYNDMERLIIDKIYYDKGAKTLQDELWDMKGSIYLSQGNLEEARASFKQVTRTIRNEYQYNPFYLVADDAVTQNRINDTTMYNKLQIVDSIIMYSYRSIADPRQGPEYLFLVGLAYYNISYYGHSSRVLDFNRSPNSYHLCPTDFSEKPTSYNVDYKDLNEARKRFLSVFELMRANPVHNRELAAKATLMLARCNLHQYCCEKGLSLQAAKQTFANLPDLSNPIWKYHKLLMEEYHQTDLYDMVKTQVPYIREFDLKHY